MQSATQSLIFSLEQLKVILPPSNVLLVGAGNGRGDLVNWLSRLKVPVTLVEASEKSFVALQSMQKKGSLSNAKIINSVVAPRIGLCQYFVHSVAAESGLLSLNQLKGLWPNLELVSSELHEALQLAQLLNEEQDHQWLFIDCLPAAALVQSCHSSSLSKLDVVLVRVIEAKDHEECLAGAYLEEVAGVLSDFIQCTVKPSRHPDISYALFVRDYRRGYEEVDKALQSAISSENFYKKINAEQKVQLKALLEKNEKLLDKLSEQDKAQTELKTELIRVSKMRDHENEIKELLAKDFLYIKEQLQFLLKDKIDIQELLNKQADNLIRVQKTLDASIKKEISNASRQLLAFSGLESYWKTGELPTVNTENHTWPISPDFSVYLVSLLEKNNYDLVIEFGSGISTVIIAKTLNKLESKRVGKFPVSFVSFDHLSDYYNQTLEMLLQAKLAERVQLKLAPLRDWKAPNGTTYSYYDCQDILASLAKQYSLNDLKILVVVDGPPAATGKHARYPAAPIVLENFGGARIDWLMDDYIREDEKEIVQLWQEEMSIADMLFKSTVQKLEKDACLLKVLTKPRARGDIEV